ncbi:GxxExxY protein [Patescibacteria group bacterium]|nr:GxxExxY protein [Patescibacteria group bacterium]
MTRKLIYKELSYKIVGVLFGTYNQLGVSYHEKYYQKAIEKLLVKEKVKFQKEFPVKIEIDGESIGKHFVDFVVEDKIVLEIKKGNRFRMGDIKQVLMYLKSSKMKLGMLAYFGSNGVRMKRIINRHFKD